MPYYFFNNSKEAVSHYSKAIDIDRELGLRQNEIRHLGNLAAVYNYLDSPSKALENYKKALEIAQNEGYGQEGLANLLGNLGTVCRNLVSFIQVRLKNTLKRQ